MTELTTTQQLSAKSLAIEAVLLALLCEKRDDPTFWNGLDKLMQKILALDSLQDHADPGIRAMADAAQDYLDSWRQIAGTSPNAPALPPAGPFDPEPGR